MLVLGTLVRQINPKAPRYLVLVPLSITSIWYWSSFAFLDQSIAFTFTAPGAALFCVGIAKSDDRMVFWRQARPLAVTALMRHQEAPFLLLLGLTMMFALIRQDPGDRRRAIWIVFSYGGRPDIGVPVAYGTAELVDLRITGDLWKQLVLSSAVSGKVTTGYKHRRFDAGFFCCLPSSLNRSVSSHC